MLAHSVQRGGRHPIGYGRGLTPIDYKWKALWPSLVSKIIGALIVLSGLLLFVLEIASLGEFLKHSFYRRTKSFSGLLGKIGITPSLYGCAVGIWAGIFVMAAGVLIFIISKYHLILYRLNKTSFV